MHQITCRAPVNIAVIKYWGKRDEDLILPINDSISATLSMDQMYAETTISVGPSFKENTIVLNGKQESFDNSRLLNCLNELQARAQGKGKELVDYNINITSENNFPTAAGLASSAAGYACLVYTLSKLYQVQGDISEIARRGSGSASRSVYGGWVQWHKGTRSDGTDSIATEIAPANHWPEMRVLILVVNDSKKKYSSTEGMKLSVKTSSFLKFRAETIVPQRILAMKKAILEKDFETFATLTMQDSNQFHSVCLDTFPPCVYMNDVSHAIVEMVHVYNKEKGNAKVAYTFDAGPNACLFLLEEDVPEVFSLINKVFPPHSNMGQYLKGIPIQHSEIKDENVFKLMAKKAPGLLKYIIHTRVGTGPEVQSESA